MTVEIFPVLGIGRVNKGDDVASVLKGPLEAMGVQSGDVVVVTHKIVSKAEGAVVSVTGNEEAFRMLLIERESASIVRRRGDLVIAETKHGFICANAGIDRSNAEPGTMILLPEDPDASAHRLRKKLEAHFRMELGLIISDTFGRPWRRGLTDVAIGISGVEAILDLKGTTDWAGRVLDVTEVAVADEMAGAADLVMGKRHGIPAAVIRGFERSGPHGRGQDLIRPAHEDLFR